MKWFIYTRGVIHLHRLAHAILSVCSFRGDLNNLVLKNALYIVKDEKLWWGWSDKEIQSLGKRIVGICDTKSGRKKYFNLLESSAKKTIKAAEKIRNCNLKKISNDELIRFYDYLSNEFTLAQVLLNSGIDAIDVVFEKFLLKKMREELKSKIREREMVDLYKKISTPFY